MLSSADRTRLPSDGWTVLNVPSSSQLIDIASDLGEPVAVLPRGRVPQTLTPMRPEDAPRRSLSATPRFGSFPPHTDAAHHRVPPRWMLLRCEELGRDRRATILVDSHTLQLSADEWCAPARAVWKVRNRLNSFLASAVIESIAEPLASRTARRRRLRYDPGCMTIADPAFRSVEMRLRDAVERAIPATVQWPSISPWSSTTGGVIHGRAHGADDDGGNRRLQRVLVASEAC
jgi:hypothetical protein